LAAKLTTLSQKTAVLQYLMADTIVLAIL